MNARGLSRVGVLLLAGWLASGAVAPIGADEPTRKNFVSCPIVRDTASVPCWLAEYAGEMSFLTPGAILREPSFKVRWLDGPAKATGVDDYLSRRVVVTVRR